MRWAVADIRAVALDSRVVGEDKSLAAVATVADWGRTFPLDWAAAAAAL